MSTYPQGTCQEAINFQQPKECWGYVDMVLASMRFPDLSLGPYKRDSTTKPFAFVVPESPSLVVPLASWLYLGPAECLETPEAGEIGAGA